MNHSGGLASAGGWSETDRGTRCYGQTIDHVQQIFPTREQMFRLSAGCEVDCSRAHAGSGGGGQMLGVVTDVEDFTGRVPQGIQGGLITQLTGLRAFHVE